MNKVGITRFWIKREITGQGAWRFEDSKKCWPIANALYREIFAHVGMTILPGEEVIECSKEEFFAGYDYQLGIDVIIRVNGGCESTLQEKFLFTDFNTVTIEHCQDWLSLVEGDWFKLKAQYYFVGYKRDKTIFSNWILLDWAKLQRATAQNRVPWRLRGNGKDNARASFMFVPFNDIPKDVIVSTFKNLPQFTLLPKF